MIRKSNSRKQKLFRWEKKIYIISISRDKRRYINEVKDKIHEIYTQKEAEIGTENLRELERVIMLKIVDQRWMDHIDNMDELKNGIGLQGYGQKDPVVQYRLLGGEMFDEMNANIKEDTVKMVLTVRPGVSTQREEVAKPISTSHGDGTVEKKPDRVDKKVGPNDPCPCGSGKKYKKCCRP